MVVTAFDGTTCAPIPNVVNGLYTDKMIDPEPLAPYGVSVRDADDAGRLLAYVPLFLDACLIYAVMRVMERASRLCRQQQMTGGTEQAA
jgi:hypothetical protein